MFVGYLVVYMMYTYRVDDSFHIQRETFVETLCAAAHLSLARSVGSEPLVPGSALAQAIATSHLFLVAAFFCDLLTSV